MASLIAMFARESGGGIRDAVGETLCVEGRHVLRRRGRLDWAMKVAILPFT